TEHYLCVRRPRFELGIFRLEGDCAVQLRQRRLNIRTLPGDRTLFHRLKVDCIAAMLAGQVTVFAYRLPVYSLFLLFRVGEAGIEPAHPSLIRRVPSPFGHSPVGKPGVEPGDYSLIRGAPSPVGYLPMAEGGGADPRGPRGPPLVFKA